MKTTIYYLAIILFVFTSCKEDKTEIIEPTPDYDALLCKEWKIEKDLKNGENIMNYEEQYFTYDTSNVLYVRIVIDEAITMHYDCMWKWKDNYSNLHLYTPYDTKNKLGEIVRDSIDEPLHMIWSDMYEVIEITSDVLVIERMKDEDVFRLELKPSVQND
ncbi:MULTISPECIES: hypothetical protein [unclassified Lentimicrobium]|uniref:hypothetical protein n=1 Tax=unclassified Lentimicrobium TaxID=2677434 RepID=UPI001555C008|nr:MULTISPECIES: hypothetical protein [unclassified Lentimicrobium]NPD48244.1 hypothetical protein [Lentimicrobium sp. S6]NPD86911.1 hypothetical protein [Lentimicrobium sp. L6]